jgi:transposase
MGSKYMTTSRPSSTVTVVASPEKRRALRAQGALNPAPEKVLADPFRSHPEFFDAEDRLQVRYEMLRGPAQGEMSVVEACRLFGVSRQTFYTLRRALEARGIAGLSEGKRGRKGPVKASVEVVEFVRDARARDPAASGAQLARMVGDRFGISLHRRTIERLLVPKSDR